MKLDPIACHTDPFKKYFNLQLMFNRYNKLINLLADKECLTCGGEYPNNCICGAKGKMPQWYIHEIMIGNVLEKMFEYNCDINTWDKADKLLRIWIKFGFTKSLQDISWREVRLNNGIIHQPKTKTETDLLLFLYKIFNIFGL